MELNGIFQLVNGQWLTVCYGTSPFLIGKSTNYFDWVIFNSYVKLSEGNLSMISGFYHDQ
jgi:hypothetical protein